MIVTASVLGVVLYIVGGGFFMAAIYLTVDAWRDRKRRGRGLS